MMTYRQEVARAVETYLFQLGFIRKHKTHKYTRKLSEDISQDIGFAFETHGRYNYYFLRATVGVCSDSLNDILFEVTDGIIDHRKRKIGPVYLSRSEYYTNKPYTDKDYIHCEFFADRSMNENVAELEQMYEKSVQVVLDAFQTQEAIYNSPAHQDKFPFNPSNTINGLYYGPLGYYFDGRFDEAFKFLDRRINIAKDNVQSCENIAGAYEDAVNELKAYEAYRKNLAIWISEQRQFEVDGKSLPIYEEHLLKQCQRIIQSLTGRLMK